MKRLNRRQFLKASSSAAAGAILSTAGCAGPAPAQEPQTTPQAATEILSEPPTSTPKPPTPTHEKPILPNTATPVPTPVVKEYRRPELIHFHPDTKSRVVRAANAKVWEGDQLSPTILRALVDQSLVSLTGLPTANEAWLALFDPSEKIAIKVNAFRNSTIWTHAPLVMAVTDSLTEAGIPGENITIFDFLSPELETAGYKVNKDQPGVRCYGSDGGYATKWPFGYTSMSLSDILVNADAVINMPVLKTHGMSGISFALKNHYGCVLNPSQLHQIDILLPWLNTLPMIKNATRLVIGDALAASVVGRGSLPYWVEDLKGDSILMSFDPLAQDRVALDMLVKMAETMKASSDYMTGLASRWMGRAKESGLGTDDLEDIDFIESKVD